MKTENDIHISIYSEEMSYDAITYNYSYRILEEKDSVWIQQWYRYQHF